MLRGASKVRGHFDVPSEKKETSRKFLQQDQRRRKMSEARFLVRGRNGRMLRGASKVSKYEGT
jgi:hypothetical protein